MEIRKLKQNEKYEANLISAYCFHAKLTGGEEKRKEAEADLTEDWGAFDGDGTLMARVMNHKFDFLLDGKTVRTGGIGNVSTLPEYREQGAVREIFRKLLPEAYRDGEVLSALYPFNQEFYRKQGYEVVRFQNNYELQPALLSGYHFDGNVVRWKNGEDVEPYLRIFNRFILGYNCALPRDEEQMRKNMKVRRPEDGSRFCYLFQKDGEDIAYVIYTDVYDAQGAILHVDESAWTCPAGFWAIMAFLGKFSADYKKIQLPLPRGIDLLRVIRTSRAYEISRTCRYDFMLRTINAHKLLEAIRKPAGTDVTVRVSDEQIPENNGTWKVTAEQVTRLPEICEGEEGAQPDLILHERTLAQLAVGSISLDEAELKPDVQVNAKEEMLRMVFPEKKILLTRFF